MNELRLKLIQEFLEDAAVRGLSCPTNAEIAMHLRAHGFKLAPNSIPSHVTELTRRKILTVSVFPGNRRQIAILLGLNAGKVTKTPKGAPYVVIDPDERARRDQKV